MIAEVICYCKMTSFMAIDGIMSVLRLKNDTNTCKSMRRSLGTGGSSSLQRKLETSNLSTPLIVRKIRNRSAPVRDLLRSRQLR